MDHPKKAGSLDTWDLRESFQWVAVENLEWCKATPVNKSGAPVKMQSHPSSRCEIPRTMRSDHWVTVGYLKWQNKLSEWQWDTGNNVESPQLEAVGKLLWHRATCVSSSKTLGMRMSHSKRQHETSRMTEINPIDWQLDTWKKAQPPKWASVAHLKWYRATTVSEVGHMRPHRTNYVSCTETLKRNGSIPLNSSETTKMMQIH